MSTVVYANPKRLIEYICDHQHTNLCMCIVHIPRLYEFKIKAFSVLNVHLWEIHIIRNVILICTSPVSTHN